MTSLGVVDGGINSSANETVVGLVKEQTWDEISPTVTWTLHAVHFIAVLKNKLAKYPRGQ